MFKNKLTNFLCQSLLVLLLPLSVHAFEVQDIRLDGLKRIAAGTVFTYLPFRVGETLDDERRAEIIKTLYATGFFLDIRLGHSGDVLVLEFKERPSIAKIEFDGNEEISDDQLEMVLKNLGLVEGRIFNPSQLEKITQELRRQYYSEGKYGVSITSELVENSDNLVEIKVQIDRKSVV